MKKFNLIIIQVSSLLFISTAPAFDGELDKFVVAGLGQPAGIPEGCDEARAVLDLVNQADTAKFRSIGLSERAADNIVTYRLGHDRTAKTNDDRIIKSLLELDAIPYVGSESFSRLLNFVGQNNLLPTQESVFGTAVCHGAGISEKDAQGILDRSKSKELGRYEYHFRRRSCTEGKGCGAWAKMSAGDIKPSAMGTAKLESTDYGINLLLQGDEVDSRKISTRCGHVGRADFVCDPSFFESSNGRLYAGIKLNGTVSKNCLRFRMFHTQRQTDDAMEYQEQETLILGKF